MVGSLTDHWSRRGGEGLLRKDRIDDSTIPRLLVKQRKRKREREMSEEREGR